MSNNDLNLAAATGKVSTDIGFKLKGENNFSLWALRIKVLLKSLGAWDEPNDKPKLVDVAHNVILGNCTIELQELMLESKSAIECWVYLFEKFRNKTLGSQLKAIMDITNHRFIKCEDKEFVEFRELVRALRAAFGAETISIDLLGVILALAHLPARHKTTRVSLQAKSGLDLAAIEKAVSEEQALSGVAGTGSALYGQTRGPNCEHGREQATKRAKATRRRR
jgi:hypothetical protein